jgi:hypothetical protein
VLKFVVKYLVSSQRSAFLLAGAVCEFESWPPLYNKFCLEITIYVGRRILCYDCHSVMMHVAVVWVGTLLCVREINYHISSHALEVLTETLCGFPGYPQANALALAKSRPQPLSSVSLPFIIQYLFYRSTPYNLRDLQAS